MKSYNETVLADVISFILKDTPDKVLKLATDNIGTNKSVKSITKSANDLVLTFPVMCSASMTKKTAELVSKALEYKYASLVQMVLASASISNVSNAGELIKNVHSNLDMREFSDLDIDDYLGIEESAKSHDKNINSITPIEESLLRQAYKEQLIRNKSNVVSLTESERKQGIGLDGLRDAYFAKAEETLGTVEEPKEEPENYTNNVAEEPSYNLPVQSNNRYEIVPVGKRELSPLNTDNIDPEIKRVGVPTANAFKVAERTLAKQVIDNKFNAGDVKKMNDLQPTLMKINFTSLQDTGNVEATAVIGVKSRLFLVDGEDIMAHLISKNSNKVSLFNFLRATTGEIKFWRDFIFSIKQAKVDSVSNSGKGSSSKLWKVLERRAIGSKLSRFLKLRNDATAITTLVITQTDVDVLIKRANIDVSRTGVARKIMDDYNLMAFIIVDETTESAKMLFDTGGGEDYEYYTFKSLKKDDKMDYKQIIDLMAKY